jgi:Ca2+-transporting ATPase
LYARTVYRNLLKAIAFILPVNGGESITILISVLLARELPILSLQVLWLNTVNSITMTVPLAFEPKSERVMQKPPSNPREPLLSPSLLQRILAISIFNWILIFGIFEWIRQTTGNIDLARTMAIQALVAGRIFYLLSISQLGSAVIVRLRGIRHRINDASAIGIGIVVNYPNLRELNPSQPASRAEIAALIHQTLVSQGRIEPLPKDSPANQYIVRTSGNNQNTQ